MNNPLRPYEACGTSGMKAALNGAANLSIRDGWWDEWYDPAFGWEIPSAEGVDDADHRDDLEAKALYDIIENEIVPRFYDVDSDGLPQRWIQMIRDTVAGLGPKVLASRMVRDYVTNLYAPAAASTHAVDAADGGAGGAGRVEAAGPLGVGRGWRSTTSSSLDGDQVEVGAKIHVSALVRLGELSPNDVEVQLVTGRVDSDDQPARAPGQPVPDRGRTSTAGCAATRAGSRPSVPARSATPSASSRTTRCWPARPRWAWPPSPRATSPDSTSVTVGTA